MGSWHGKSESFFPNHLVIEAFLRTPRGEGAQGAARAVLVAASSIFAGCSSRLLQISPQTLFRTLLSQATADALDVRVLRRLSRFDAVPVNAALIKNSSSNARS